MWSVATLARTRVIRRAPETYAFGLFWLVSFALLACGTVAAAWNAVWEPGSLRDASAYVLCAATSWLFVALPEFPARLLIAARTMLLGIVLPAFLLLCLAAIGRRAIGPIESYYQEFRFQALTVNPNQLAMVFLPLPFVAIWLGSTTGHGGRYALAVLACIACGAASLSDALALGWSGGLAVSGAMAWARSLARPRTSLARAGIARIVIPVTVFVVAAAAAAPATTAAYKLLEAGYSSGEHGADRRARWGYAFAATAHSPVVGLGPGSFSGPTGSFQGEEAHNTAVDWLASTGAVGVIALVALVLSVAVPAVKLGDTAGLGLLAAATLFVQFHFIMRQPVFWFGLVVIAAAPTRALLAPES